MTEKLEGTVCPQCRQRIKRVSVEMLGIETAMTSKRSYLSCDCMNPPWAADQGD